MFFFFGFVSCISTVTCYSSVRFTSLRWFTAVDELLGVGFDWVTMVTSLLSQKSCTLIRNRQRTYPQSIQKLQNSPVQTHRLYLKRGWYFSLHPFVDGSKWGVQTCCITLVCVDHDAWCSPGWNSLTGKYNTRSYQMNNIQREVVLLGGQII